MKAQDIVNILRETGPQTGWQLLERSGLEALPLWQICRQALGIRLECAGKRFLRLDRNVEGYARLSPSVRREFLTYTLLGLENQAAEIEAMARRLRQEMRQVSQAKWNLARDVIDSAVQSLSGWESIEEQVCFIIAGDIVYGMAHAVPRPETSTGKMVRGSDLDVVAIAEDRVSREALTALDDILLKKKYFLLVHPDYQEEIDYLVKNMAKVRQQLAFESFPHMVASKIIHEGRLLYGSAAVYQKIKEMVEESGVPGKLALLEQRAIENRKAAEISLLQSDASRADDPFLNLFFTREEDEEIF